MIFHAKLVKTFQLNALHALMDIILIQEQELAQEANQHQHVEHVNIWIELRINVKTVAVSVQHALKELNV